jgi:CheY-like chemotaxis protein
MRAPADSGTVVSMPAAPTPLDKPPPEMFGTSSTSSPRCLVVEDQVLIAMALEASLEEAGFAVAGPFPSNAEALNWLEHHTPDLALLDVLLKDGPCTSLVRALRARSIPFAIYSGLRPGNRPPDLETVRWLEKPVSRDDLADVLREIAPKMPDGASARTPSPEVAAAHS